MKLRLPARLEIIAASTGLALMGFELVAARILAPTIGSSTYIWTNVIGVIIAALSLGYYLGGKLSDARKQTTDVGLLLSVAALLVILVIYFSPGFLSWVVTAVADARFQGLMAAIVLFAPTSLVLGMVSPYLAKLSVTSLKTSGSAVANLSAWNAIGSIIGTFVTGFILFELIGSRQTLAVVTLVLVAASWLLWPKVLVKWQLALGLAALLLTALVLFVPQRSDAISIDTAMANYQVTRSEQNGRAIVSLSTGPGGTQSSRLANGSSELLFWYAQQMVNAVREAPNRDRILLIGGGAFTIPAYLSEYFPDSVVDVVEIDPGLLRISEDYFSYQRGANTNIIFADARSFVNQTANRYDVILVDAYSDAEVPWHLMTREFGQRIHEITNQGGVVVVNAIAGRQGDCRLLFDAISGGFREAFSHAQFTQRYPEYAGRQNFAIVFTDFNLPLVGFAPLPPALNPAFTDNFAPVDGISGRCNTQQ